MQKRKKNIMGKNKIQQFALSPKKARENVSKSINDPFGNLRRDYQGMHVSLVRTVKKQPTPEIKGRKLYNIYLEKD
jgi:hypothetical protein